MKILIITTAVMMYALLVGYATADSWVLSTQCPPSFELTKQNQCKLVSLYQQYESLQDQGVGGLKTALPENRDGFSPQQIDLGRYLFFDPYLSKDNTISCASCHNPDLGFADGAAVSAGVGGQLGTRSAPSLWNVAFKGRLFWDGRADSLEAQIEGPLYHPTEMGLTRVELLNKLNASETYVSLFKQAFDIQSTGLIQLPDIYSAIIAFETSLISLNSRYDWYAHGYADALTQPELEGLNIFRSFVARCAECHTPPLFTNQQYAVIGSPELKGMPFDIGAQNHLELPDLRGGFQVPSLRNIELTAPYMHNGAFSDLRSSVAFYTEGRGHAVPEDENLKLHWHIWEPNLTETEIDRLVDFLKTLTDESLKPVKPEAVPSGLAVP
ncbi:cytochrome-c peroxidase [Reinekea forsetii]|nr:cytochrome-c peroxidase [Reinekea forsetii]